MSIPTTCPLGGDHLGGDERVRPRAAAQVEDALAGLQPTQREGIGDACERFHGEVGDAGELRGIVEILRPGAARGEHEVFLGLGRDARVGLLDLAFQKLDIDLDFNCHQTSSISS